MGAKCSCDPCEDRDAGLSSAAAAFLDAQPAIRPREQFEVGLCLSGGGLASAAAAVGALRALEAADLMEQFDALSVVSGSAWASAAYMFDKEPASSLLGEIAPLTALTLEALDALPPPALQGCTREAAVSKVFFGAEVPIEELRQAVAKSWLEDFSLDHLAYLAGGEEKKRRIIEAAPQLQDKDFLLPRRDRPKTWMVGAALSSEDGSVLPFAVTPSRVSAPADEDSSPRPSEAVVYPFYRDLERNSLFSRGEVETFAFGGREALSIDSPPFQPGSPVIRLAAPTEPFSLSDALTMSGLSAAAQLFPGLPKPARWPVKDVTGLSSGEDVSFVSGDVADSSGLLTLLQRGIRRIVWFELGPGDGSPNARIQPFSKDVLRKFGCTGYGETSCHGQQVFQDSQLPSLILHLQQMLKQGSPGILRRSLQVLPNKRWCIKGGFTLELLLIHIDKVESFEQELPEETRAELEKGDEGSLRGFPFFHPWAFAGHLAKLTNRQANLLAALAEHIVGQALPSIRSLIRPPVPPLQMSFAQKLLEQPTTESTVHKV